MKQINHTFDTNPLAITNTVIFIGSLSTLQALEIGTNANNEMIQLSKNFIALSRWKRNGPFLNWHQAKGWKKYMPPQTTTMSLPWTSYVSGNSIYYIFFSLSFPSSTSFFSIPSFSPFIFFSLSTVCLTFSLSFNLAHYWSKEKHGVTVYLMCLSLCTSLFLCLWVWYLGPTLAAPGSKCSISMRPMSGRMVSTKIRQTLSSQEVTNMLATEPLVKHKTYG